MCSKCGLCNNQRPLLDSERPCQVFWVGLSAKKITSEEERPLSEQTNTGKLYNDIVSEKGIVHECEFNDIISKFKGRNQFNFAFGNYSEVSDEILNQYIIKTQEIGEGNA